MGKIKLICLDLDQTLIDMSSWKELSLGLGMSEAEDARLYCMYKAGGITYEEWNKLVLERYLEHTDANREGITKILSQYRYTHGARELVEYLKGRGYILVLVSGSIDIIVNLVAKDLGISYAKANNTFVFDDAERLISIHTHGNDTIAKADHLESFCEMLGVAITECVCIGDGDNDIEMFRRTGHGITFRGSPIETDAWKIVVSLSDIQTIL